MCAYAQVTEVLKKSGQLMLNDIPCLILLDLSKDYKYDWHLQLFGLTFITVQH